MAVRRQMGNKMQRSSPSASGDMIQRDSCKTGGSGLAVCYGIFIDHSRCDLTKLDQTVQDDDFSGNVGWPGVMRLTFI